MKRENLKWIHEISTCEGIELAFSNLAGTASLRHELPVWLITALSTMKSKGFLGDSTQLVQCRVGRSIDRAIVLTAESTRVRRWLIDRDSRNLRISDASNLCAGDLEIGNFCDLPSDVIDILNAFIV